MDEPGHAEEAFIQVQKDTTKPKPKLLGSCRFKFGIVVFLANLIAYLHRVNLNMVIVCMIDEPEVVVPEQEAELEMLSNEFLFNKASNHSHYDQTYQYRNVKENISLTDSNHWVRQAVIDQSEDLLAVNKTILTSRNNSGISFMNATTMQQSRFDWDKPQISFLLASYYYGCIFTQVPGGYFSHRFGGKHVVTAFFVCTMLGTFLSPIAAKTHFALLFAVRVMLGLASGLFTPAIYSLTFKWTKPTERATLLSFVVSGQPLGIVIAYMSSGFFCALGWSSIFYAHGGITVIMLCLWIYEVHSSPGEHPRISSEEKNYLIPDINKSTLKTIPPTPWKSVLTSNALFVSTLAHFSYNWSYFTFIINVPMFLKEAFGFIIAENGVLSAVPYIFCTISLMFSGTLSDAIISKKWLDVQRTRKLLAGISLGGTAVCLISAGHVTYELRYVAVLLVCLSCIFSGLAFGGIFPSFGDYAGVFSGTVFAVSNSLGVLAVILSAMSAGFLTPNGLQTEWQNAFYIAAGLNLFSAVIFILFGKATLQKWARVDTDINMEVEVEPNDKKVLNNDVHK